MWCRGGYGIVMSPLRFRASQWRLANSTTRANLRRTTQGGGVAIYSSSISTATLSTTAPSTVNGTAPYPAPADTFLRSTDPNVKHPPRLQGVPVRKRLIVACDGTWQDGISRKYKWQFTNILKLARAIYTEDSRWEPPIPQVVFYQSGVGSEKNLYSKWFGGAFGAGLGEKVEEAYAFIANNYTKGDEIFLFGFSRGAYTARMVADFIGGIGILNKTDMEKFADIFTAYQSRGKPASEEEQAKTRAILEPYTSHNAPGKRLVESVHPFAIKLVAVFDTVGSLGLPGELVAKDPEAKLFGFNDRRAGAHIEKILHAMALNEPRKDFDVTKFEQTPKGKEKGQSLTQCWFSGAHTDVGGGYQFHDLSDLTLSWVVANIDDSLAIDHGYITKSLSLTAPYGAQIPHDSATGLFRHVHLGDRDTPLHNSPITHEYVHPSVKLQPNLRPDVAALIKAHPDVLWTLKPFEETVQKSWLYDPNALKPDGEESEEAAEDERGAQESFSKSAEREIKMAEEEGENFIENTSKPVNGDIPNMGVKIVPQRSS